MNPSRYNYTQHGKAQQTSRQVDCRQYNIYKVFIYILLYATGSSTEILWGNA